MPSAVEEKGREFLETFTNYIRRRLDEDARGIDDCHLRWEPGPAGCRYDVFVTTADHDVVDEARGLTFTEYHVPPERLAAAACRGPLLWWVEGSTRDGTRILPAPQDEHMPHEDQFKAFLVSLGGQPGQRHFEALVTYMRDMKTTGRPIFRRP